MEEKRMTSPLVPRLFNNHRAGGKHNDIYIYIYIYIYISNQLQTM